MQVLHIVKTRRGARKAGRWSRELRRRALGPGLAAAAAGIAGAVALTAALVTRPAGSQSVTIRAGTSIVGTLVEALSTADSRKGQPVTLQTREPFRISEEFTLPAGIVIRGRILQSSGGRGVPELSIGFTGIEIAGENYSIAAEPFRVGGRKAEPPRKGGAASRHASATSSPGDAGTDGAVGVTGDQIVLPAGQRILIRFSEPVSVGFHGNRTTRGSNSS